MKPATFLNQKLLIFFSDSSPQSQARLQRLAEVGAVSGHSLRWVGKAWEGFRWFRWFRWPRTQGIRWHGSKWRSQRLEHLTSWLTAFSVGSKSRLGVLGWWSFLDLWDTLTSGKCLSVWVFGFGCFYAKFALFTAKCRSFAKKKKNQFFALVLQEKSQVTTSPSFGSWHTWHFLPAAVGCLPKDMRCRPFEKVPNAWRSLRPGRWVFWNLQNAKITKITKIYKMPIVNSGFFGDFKKFCKKSSLNISDTRFHLKIGIEFSFPAEV